MLADVLIDLFCCVSLSEGVRILALGQQHSMETHPALQPHVQSPHGCLDASCIGVENKGEIGRKALDLLYLLRRESGPGAGDHVGYPSLMHRQYIHIALHNDALVLLGNRLLGEVEPIELTALVVDRGGGRIDVLPRILLLDQDPAPKAYYRAADRVDGVDHTIAVSVDVLSVVGPEE